MGFTVECESIKKQEQRLRTERTEIKPNVMK